MNNKLSVSACVFASTGVRLLNILRKKDVKINCIYADKKDNSKNLNKIKEICEINSIKLVMIEDCGKDSIEKFKRITNDKYLLLLWWPHILKEISIKEFEYIINIHPSMLPFGKGKYGYFWSIVNKEPFGASIHLVDRGIDTGNILAQKIIKPDPRDTGGGLYMKGLDTCIELLLLSDVHGNHGSRYDLRAVSSVSFVEMLRSS